MPDPKRSHGTADDPKGKAANEKIENTVPTIYPTVDYVNRTLP